MTVPGWWVPLSGFSWLPSKIACGPLLLLQAPSPHPSIVDRFNLHWRRQCGLAVRAPDLHFVGPEFKSHHWFASGQLGFLNPAMFNLN